MNDDYLNYLGLSSKDFSCFSEEIKSPPTKKCKNAKYFQRFIPKVSITTIICNPNILKIAEISDCSTLAPTKNKIICQDFEAYVNSNKYLESIFTRQSRKALNSSAILSRSSRIVKRNLKNLDVPCKKLSFEDILKMKISKETRKFIEKRLKIESNEPIQELNNEVICLESRFNSIHNQKFYPENYFINEFRKSELVDDFESLSPSYDSISFKNYNEQNVIISKNSPVEIFLNHLSFNNCYLPKETSKIDLIDITDL